MPVAYVQAQLACQIEWLGQLILRAILLVRQGSQVHRHKDTALGPGLGRV